MTHVRFDWRKLENFSSNIFQKLGINKHEADIIAKSLIQADLRGVDSHGVVRTSIYVKRIEEGMINPNGNITVEDDYEGIALVKGDNHFGSIVGTKALEVAIEKAKKSGTGIVGVKESNHFGTGAYYGLKAIDENIILIVMSNASQTMPPTGGVKPFLGTNPLTVAIPSGEETPFLLDMATSVVARGKIIVANQKHQNIPLGWAVDKEGIPTTNPSEALEGSVLPLGGAKGYGISMFIDILSGVLTGAGFGKYVNNMYENWNEPQNVGHLFITIDISKFMQLDEFKQRMDKYIKEIKKEPKATGVDEILIPGEIEKRTEEYRKKYGIVLPTKVVEELQKLGEKYKVDLRTAVINKQEVEKKL